MSTKGWRKNTSVTRRLLEEPFRFQFLQAVRLLERSAVYETRDKPSPINTLPVARYSPPAQEFIRFCGNPSLTFHGAEVEKVERLSPERQGDQWKLLLNFIGLTGSMGVMPFHYSELILQRLKLKDDAMLHFLDLFNHRTASLFYQASIKYRLPLQVERNKLIDDRKKQQDRHTRSLLSLIGFGTDGLQNRLGPGDEMLLQYAGLLSQKVRNASNLKQLVSHHLQVPVEVEQFVGHWMELIEDVRTRLPDRQTPQGCNAGLGRNAMLGKKGWYAQGHIRIVIGPLHPEQLKRFSPGTQTLKILNQLLRLYLGMETEYQIRIRVLKNELPEKISLSRQTPPIVGWNTWLSKRADAATGNETLDISIGAGRLG